MKYKKTLSVLLGIAISMSLATGANAGQRVEKLHVAGSFLTSRIDTNSDGDASSWCTSQINGGFKGSSMLQCVNEDVFIGMTPECPGGEFIVDASNNIGTGSGVRTFPNGKDQIYLVLTERRLCANEFGQITNGVDRGLIVGGVGRFEEATGTYEWNYSGQILFADPAAMPAQYFGALVGTGTWVINTP